MKQQLLATLGLFCFSALGGAAEFAPPVRLKAGGVPIRVEAPGYAAPCLADVDGDGKMDLLVGDCVTLVSPAKGISDTEFARRYADWNKEFQAAQESLKLASDDAARKKATEEYHKVYRQRSAFMHEEMTGFVWLYLQK